MSELMKTTHAMKITHMVLCMEEQIEAAALVRQIYLTRYPDDVDKAQYWSMVEDELKHYKKQHAFWIASQPE